MIVVGRELASSSEMQKKKKMQKSARKFYNYADVALTEKSKFVIFHL